MKFISSVYFAFSKQLRAVSQQSTRNENKDESGTISYIGTMKIEKKNCRILFQGTSIDTSLIWSKVLRFFSFSPLLLHNLVNVLSVFSRN